MKFSSKQGQVIYRQSYQHLRFFEKSCKLVAIPSIGKFENIHKQKKASSGDSIRLLKVSDVLIFIFVGFTSSTKTLLLNVSSSHQVENSGTIYMAIRDCSSAHAVSTLL